MAEDLGGGSIPQLPRPSAWGNSCVLFASQPGLIPAVQCKLLAATFPSLPHCSCPLLVLLGIITQTSSFQILGSGWASPRGKQEQSYILENVPSPVHTASFFLLSSCVRLPCLDYYKLESPSPQTDAPLGRKRSFVHPGICMSGCPQTSIALDNS